VGPASDNTRAWQAFSAGDGFTILLEEAKENFRAVNGKKRWCCSCAKGHAGAGLVGTKPRRTTTIVKKLKKQEELEKQLAIQKERLSAIVARRSNVEYE
jgi:hypothetical protein